jgi:hypothetical protein
MKLSDAPESRSEVKGEIERSGMERDIVKGEEGNVFVLAERVAELWYPGRRPDAHELFIESSPRFPIQNNSQK